MRVPVQMAVCRERAEGVLTPTAIACQVSVAGLYRAPVFILPLLIPIEIFSTFIVRPVTLALRLFANMFAGHMILLVFILGGFAVLNVNVWFAPVSLLSWVLAIALTFLEALVAILQAYVFVILTSSYIQLALAEEH